VFKPEIENGKSKIAIVGAGPAGTTLAIRLAQKNFDVCLIERERFPRHKLCGEFISPECFGHFRELEVFDEMMSAGGERISETIFYAPSGKNVTVPSKWFNADGERGALSLSRAEMDFVLLEKAKAFGVRVYEETSVSGVLFEKEKISAVKIKTNDNQSSEVAADLFVDATGRARILGKFAEKEISRRVKTNGSRIQNPKSKIQNSLVGFKTHLKNVNLDKGACEIYFFKGGYGGLSFVEDNLANFCFLIKSELVKDFNSDAQQIIEKIIFQNERARQTLVNAAPVQDWLAVAVDGFGKKDLNAAPNLFAVGDAGAFIDPFTGSGMLMALESAEILARAIAAEAFFPEKIAEIYEGLHKEKFQKRLRVCSLIRKAAFTPNLAAFAISVLSLSGTALEFLAQSTRQMMPTGKNER
jgi:flavin-dependent dehydrogenase